MRINTHLLLLFAGCVTAPTTSAGTTWVRFLLADACGWKIGYEWGLPSPTPPATEPTVPRICRITSSCASCLPDEDADSCETRLGNWDWGGVLFVKSIVRTGWGGGGWCAFAAINAMNCINACIIPKDGVLPMFSSMAITTIFNTLTTFINHIKKKFSWGDGRYLIFLRIFIFWGAVFFAVHFESLLAPHRSNDGFIISYYTVVRYI